MRLIHRCFVAVAVLVAFGVVRPASAELILVTSRAALDANDSRDWGFIGDGSGRGGSFATTSSGGIPLTIADNPSGNFLGYIQGGDWNGNFSPGDAVLYNSDWGDISISSSVGLTGIGTQVNPFFNGAYVARISAYDSQGDLLGSFTESSVRTGSNDGSAIFLGVENTSAADTAIAKVVYSLDSGPVDARALAINEVSINSIPSSVPEPSSLALLVGCCAIGWLGYRRTRGDASRSPGRKPPGS